MESKKNIETGFLVQGSILAIASIVSRILGLIYRIPLTAIIGKTGNDYYGTAFEIYNIILIISSYSLPLAVSKMVAARMAEGKVKNTRRVFKASLVFALFSGTTAGVLVFFFADFLAGDVLKTPFSVLALLVLSPVLLIVAIMGVFRGFFQGLGTTVPSAISQIIEQIINAIVSIAAAYYLVTLGQRVGAVLGDEKVYRAAYGAAGGTLGTGAGAFVALLFLLGVYFIYKRAFKKRLIRDHSKDTESYLSLAKILMLTIVPVLLSTTLYNISAIVDQGIFKNLAISEGYDKALISEYWGVFTGQYKVLINVPVAIASALAATSVPALTASFKQNNKKLVRKQIRLATRFITVIAFPCMMGMAVLSGPLMQLLFNDSVDTSGWMLTIGSVSIIFYSISTLSNAILQGIDKMSIPVRNAAIALVLQVGFLYIAMEVFDLHIYAVVLTNAFYAFLMCVLNGMSVRRYTRVRMSIRRTYIIPLMCSLIMGGLVYIVYILIMFITNINALATIFSICVGVVVYFVLMLYLRGLTRKDLAGFPKGHLLIKAGEKLRLL